MHDVLQNSESHPPVSTIHEPVMGAEVTALLSEHRPLRIVDATLGTGGHAAMLLEAAPAGSCLLGLDRDVQALALAAVRLERFGQRAILRHADFAAIAEVVREVGFGGVDALLADLGMSSFALDDPSRGFSFMREGPLDMRMDVGSNLRAYDLVNEEPEADLARIIYEYGEERGSRRIARTIVEARAQHPVETTGELRALIERAVGGRRGGGVHPATRTFQALRIAVNDELGSLRTLLDAGPQCLAPGGRMVVIAYHSLEDRMVKTQMRELARLAGHSLVNRKAMRPGPEEIARNSRARSARLRCLQRNP
jgi:16S rRNA (cytosine1402-N4)-methyltransferase